MLKKSDIAKGLRHLRERDPVIAAVIARAEKFAIELEPDLFQALVRSIVGQQISGSAARSIHRRLTETAGGGQNFAQVFQHWPLETFRAAGISAQKAGYLQDLARKTASGEVQLAGLAEKSNGEVITELTRVKGIGEWTAHMVLIFSLGRLDVFPTGDLGVRAAIQKLYRKRTLPKPRQLVKFEKLWQPYASIASWYCWRSLEFKD